MIQINYFLEINEMFKQITTGYILFVHFILNLQIFQLGTKTVLKQGLFCVWRKIESFI